MNRVFVAAVESLVLLGGVLAEIAWIILWPSGETGDVAANVAAVAASPAAADTAVWLNLPILLLVPSVLIVGRVVGAGRRPLATVATWLAFIGSLMNVFSLTADVVNIAAATTGGAATAEAYFTHSVVLVGIFGGLALQIIGFVLLGIAALRSGTLPVWAAIALMLAPLVQFAGNATGISLLTALGYLVLGLGYLPVAVGLWRVQPNAPAGALAFPAE